MTVSEIYNLLGTVLSASITEPFTEAWMDVQRTTAYADFSGFYTDAAGKRQVIRELLVDQNTSKAVHELHAITTEGGNNRWNRLHMSLKPDGAFGMDFIHDEKLAALVGQP